MRYRKEVSKDRWKVRRLTQSCSYVPLTASCAGDIARVLNVEWESGSRAVGARKQSPRECQQFGRQMNLHFRCISHFFTPVVISRQDLNIPSVRGWSGENLSIIDRKVDCRIRPWAWLDSHAVLSCIKFTSLEEHLVRPVKWFVRRIIGGSSAIQGDRICCTIRTDGTE